VAVADVPGDFDLLVDDDGDCYHVQTTTNDPAALNGFVVTKLNSGYTGPASPTKSAAFKARSSLVYDCFRPTLSFARSSLVYECFLSTISFAHSRLVYDCFRPTLSFARSNLVFGCLQGCHAPVQELLFFSF
jgi:hypothetical protein